MAILGKQLTLTPRAKASLQSANPNSADATSRGTISLDNILKLIPGDVVALYIAGTALAPPLVGPDQAREAGAQLAGSQPVSTTPTLTLWATFWICFAVCALLRIVATRPAGSTGLSLRGVNWSFLIFTLIGFFIWAHAVSPYGPVVPSFHGAVAGFIAMVFGVVAPLFVKTGN